MSVMTWWAALCAAAMFNCSLCGLTAWQIHRERRGLRGELHALRVRLLALAALYTLGCAFRSVWPMIDVPRLCLHSTWISRIAVGRSVATVAELSLAAQLALLLRAASAGSGGQLAGRISRLIVPLIALAELLSWAAVLQQNYLFHAFENSCWTLMAVLLIAALVPLRSRAREGRRAWFGIAIVCAAGYVAYMGLIDVPMYVSRWHGELAAQQPMLSWSAGLAQILQRCTVERDFALWRQDVPWLSLYFTVAVWISLALAYTAPAVTWERGRRQ